MAYNFFSFSHHLIYLLCGIFAITILMTVTGIWIKAVDFFYAISPIYSLIACYLLGTLSFWLFTKYVI